MCLIIYTKIMIQADVILKIYIFFYLLKILYLLEHENNKKQLTYYERLLKYFKNWIFI